MIVTRQGAGSFVADGAGGSAEIERIAAEAILAARAAGVDPREVAVAAHVGASVRGARGAPWVDEAGARAALREQIARIEAELASYTRDLPAASRRPSSPRRARTSPASASSRRPATRSSTGSPRLVRPPPSARRAEGGARSLRDAIVADPGATPRQVGLGARDRRAGLHDVGVGAAVRPARAC